jgi:kinetochore protein Spc7/SPC105
LKNFQGSPVKKVKLNPPPSKEETTGRITRATRRSLEAASGNAITPTAAPSPVKDAIITTPRGQGRFKDAEALPGAEKAIPFEAIPTQNVPIVVAEDKAQDRMQLQDFLNLTSIRFMELTTTKRRHTVAPGSLGKNISDKENGKNDGSLESCVVAGACTLPMLELFQHVSALSA